MSSLLVDPSPCLSSPLLAPLVRSSGGSIVTSAASSDSTDVADRLRSENQTLNPSAKDSVDDSTLNERSVDCDVTATLVQLFFNVSFGCNGFVCVDRTEMLPTVGLVEALEARLVEAEVEAEVEGAVVGASAGVVVELVAETLKSAGDSLETFRLVGQPGRRGKVENNQIGKVVSMSEITCELIERQSTRVVLSQVEIIDCTEKEKSLGEGLSCRSSITVFGCQEKIQKDGHTDKQTRVDQQIGQSSFDDRSLSSEQLFAPVASQDAKRTVAVTIGGTEVGPCFSVFFVSTWRGKRRWKKRATFGRRVRLMARLAVLIVARVDRTQRRNATDVHGQTKWFRFYGWKIHFPVRPLRWRRHCERNFRHNAVWRPRTHLRRNSCTSSPFRSAHLANQSIDQSKAFSCGMERGMEREKGHRRRFILLPILAEHSKEKLHTCPSFASA